MVHFGWEISRNSSQSINGAVRGAPNLEGPGFWYTNTTGSIFEIKTALPIDDKNRITKSLPSKGWGLGDVVFQSLRPKNMTNPKG